MVSTDWLTFGLETASISADLARWTYEEIRPFVKGDILEVGSGTGTYSEMLYRDFAGRLFLTDIHPSYLAQLRNRFQNGRVVVRSLDLNSREHFEALGGHKFDTVVCMNVLEHVRNDVLSLSSLKRLLRPEGVLVLLVPAYGFLYNTIDRAIGHHRRYTKRELILKLNSAGFAIRRIFYYNMFGILGWYVSGSILRRPDVDRGALSYFNRLVPIFRVVERLVPFRPAGISIIAICTKGSDSGACR